MVFSLGICTNTIDLLSQGTHKKSVPVASGEGNWVPGLTLRPPFPFTDQRLDVLRTFRIIDHILHFRFPRTEEITASEELLRLHLILR